VALIALGVTVRAVPGALAEEDAALVHVEQAVAIGPRSLGERVARTAVGAPDRRPYFRVIQLYSDAVLSAGSTSADAFGDVNVSQGRHGAEELRIGGVLARLDDPQERSHAATMLGTLILLHSGNGRAIGGQVLVQQAVGNFQEAIRRDPTNEAAKYDLELLLKMHTKREAPQQSQKPAKRDPKARGGQPQLVTGGNY
jgi:hypothetical protein